jgi:flavin-binding protein dodecin
MSVARDIEITSTSPKSFEHAIQQGISRAANTVGEVRSAWIKEEQMDVEKGHIVAYTVTLMISVLMEDKQALSL